MWIDILVYTAESWMMQIWDMLMMVFYGLWGTIPGFTAQIDLLFIKFAIWILSLALCDHLI